MLSVKIVMTLTGLSAKELAEKLGVPWQRLNKRDSNLLSKSELLEKLGAKEWSDELSHYKNIESVFSESAEEEVIPVQVTASTGSWMDQLSGDGNAARYNRANFEGEDAGVIHYS